MLLAPDSQAPTWASDWDQILLIEGPGPATLYAFTAMTAANPSSLRERIDRLAAGLAGAGLFGGGVVELVTVAVFPHGLSPEQRRGVTRVVPSTFYSGVRPATWAIDLPQGVVYTPSLIRRPEGSKLLRQALTEMHSGAHASESFEILEQRRSHQVQAFRGLMQGRQPVVTYGLIAINVLIYLLLSHGGGQESNSTLREFGAMSPRLVEDGQWWRLVSEMFLHASLPHILFNMTSLFAVGTLAERLYGSAKFLAIYLGAGLIGSLTSFGYAVATGNVDILAVGASGAIFGIAGALVTVRFQPSDVIPKQLRDRISSSMIPLIVISLGLASITQYVDNSAHIGGLLGGIALSFAFPLTRRVARVGP